MRIFVTGATGFIGTPLVKELIAAGHQVIGMCRSDDKAAELVAAGAEPHLGSIKDVDSVTAGVAKADGTIHLAFNHDFSTFAANCEDDRKLILAMGAVLKGTNKPLVITSGTGMSRSPNGGPATEDGPPITSDVVPRAASEEAGRKILAEGVNLSVMRLPQVHDTWKQGLITPLIDMILEKGVAAYVGEGKNRWAAGHVSDVVKLFRMAIERAEAGAIYNAAGEEGVSHRDIAEVLGKRLNLPVKSVSAEEAPAHFGWMAMFMNHDMSASSAITRNKTGWDPKGPSLLDDLANLSGHPA